MADDDGWLSRALAAYRGHSCPNCPHWSRTFAEGACTVCGALVDGVSASLYRCDDGGDAECCRRCLEEELANTPYNLLSRITLSGPDLSGVEAVAARHLGYDAYVVHRYGGDTQ